MDGLKLLQQTLTEPVATVDISHLPNGVYIVKVTNEKFARVVKLLKQ